MPDQDPDLTYRRVFRRIIPFMFVLYVLAHIDRGNIAFAKSQLADAFGFTDAVYGIGVGMFYLGYSLLEVPSNLILARVGARRWIARIMATWGLVCMGMMLVQGATSFYVARFLLGLAEAGFMPGAILFLTFWFPARLRARAAALFLTSIPVAMIVSGPLSGACLNLDGALGFAGWQWLFVLEGLPSLVAAFVVLKWLPDGPHAARWLAPAERERIAADLAAERGAEPHEHPSLWRLLANPGLWGMMVVYCLLITGFYGINNWLPPILKAQPFMKGLGNVGIGCVTAIPYVLAAVVMVLVARASDRTSERRWHAAVPGAAAAIAMVVAACLSREPVAVAACLSVTCVGMFAALGPFWSLCVERLGGKNKVAGIAAINSFGCLGGFAGPSLVGSLDREWGYAAMAAAFALFAAGVLTLRARRGPEQSIGAALPARIPVEPLIGRLSRA
jgi:sugar phosphate permease